MITTNIAIGARDEVSDIKILKDMGITHLLNLTSVVPNHFPDNFIYHNMAVQGM